MAGETSDELPVERGGDFAHNLLRAAISSVPGVGGAAAELITFAIATPVLARRDAWFKRLNERVRALEKGFADFHIADLLSNEAFVTAFMHATATALKNHRAEKLDALCNAVLNSALPNPPDSDVQLIFLGWVESLTPLHLRILSLLNNPENWGDWSKKPPLPGTTGLVENVIEFAFPDQRGNKDVYSKVVRDLTNDGLLGPARIHPTVNGRAVLAPRASEIGRRFLAFISPPALPKL